MARARARGPKRAKARPAASAASAPRRAPAKRSTAKKAMGAYVAYRAAGGGGGGGGGHPVHKTLIAASLVHHHRSAVRARKDARRSGQPMSHPSASVGPVARPGAGVGSRAHPRPARSAVAVTRTRAGGRGGSFTAAAKARKAARKVGGSAGSRPFKSKAQWRLFYANPRLRKWAHQKAHATEAAGGGPKIAYRGLPTRKGGPSARTAR